MAACASTLACGSAGQLPRELPRELLQDILGRKNLTADEAKALYERFRKLAPWGWLCLDQFKVSMGVLGLTDDPFIAERMFDVFDADGDGRLCFSEFSASLGVMLRGTEDQKLKLSFDMVAGRKGWIAKADFKRLVSACNAAMASLAVPQEGLTKEDEVDRLFEELASYCGEVQDGEPVLSLEGYRLAAETNEEFLQCLGLCQQTAAGRRMSRERSSPPRGARPEGELLPSVAAAAEPAQVHTTAVPTTTLEQLQRRLEMLSQIVRDVRGDGDQFQQLRSVVQNLSSERLWLAESEPPSPSCPGDLQRLKPGLDDLVVGKQTTSGGGVVQAMLSGAFAWCVPSSVSSATDHLHEIAASPRARDQYEDLGLALEKSPKSGVLDRVATELDGLLGLCHQCQEERAPALQARGAGGRAAPVALGASPPGPGQVPPSGAQAPLTPKAAQQRAAMVAAGAAEGAATLRPPPPVMNRLQSRRLPTLSMAYPITNQKHRLLGPKVGQAVHFGHENWNMVVSMMIGIRLSIGRARGECRREMQPVDFTMKEKFTIAPRCANIFDSTAPRRADKYRFIDYAPMVFQRIRHNLGIDPDEYLHSVGPEQLLGNMILGNLSSLSEQTSEGKSGAFFYYTADGKYMLKTVSRAEYRTLKGMIKEYYDHLRSNPQTLLVRFLGLHCLSVMEHLRGTESVSHSTQKMYFVVMANMLNTPVEIHRKYDLKGSWVGRSTDDSNREHAVLKDVDFKASSEQIRIGPEQAQRLAAQLEADTKFLCENQIIDYSLLIGIHDMDRGVERVTSEDNNLRRTPSDESAHQDAPIMSSWSSGQPGQQHLASLPEHQRCLGGMLSSDRKSLYFLGVIDMFKTYDARAKVEHHAKALVYDRAGVSCCCPELYRSRFMTFMTSAMV